MNNVLGCRVNNALEKAVRKRAENNGKTVQDVMNEVLNKEFDILPEIESVDVNVNAVEVTEKINELKLKVKKLETSYPEGFLSSRDDDIQACIDALNMDIKKLSKTLPNAKEGLKEDTW